MSYKFKEQKDSASLAVGMHTYAPVAPDKFSQFFHFIPIILFPNGGKTKTKQKQTKIEGLKFETKRRGDFERERGRDTEIEAEAVEMKSSISGTRSQNLLEAIKSSEVSFLLVLNQIQFILFLDFAQSFIVFYFTFFDTEF